MMSKDKVVVVLGMHRSGTSAITRSLKLMGVELGENLHPAGFDNPKGFWEDRECLELNEAILRHCSSRYDRLSLREQFSQVDDFMSSLKIKAEQLVCRKLKESGGVWGFKDPRSCRLLPFWKNVFDSVGCEAKYIIALRNPMSVASSLAERNKIAFEKSYFLWLQHVLPSVFDTVGYSRVVVDYDLFMDSPLEQIYRISHELNFSPVDANSLHVKVFLDDFLDKCLRHTKFSFNELDQDGCVPNDAVVLYEMLLRVARDELSLDSQEIACCVNSLRSRLDAYSPAFVYMNALEDQCEVLTCAISNLNQTIAASNEQIAFLTRAAEDRDLHISNLNQTIAASNEQIAFLAHAAEDREEHINNLNLVIADRDAQIADTQQFIAAQDDEITAFLHSRSWKITRPLRQIGALTRKLLMR